MNDDKRNLIILVLEALERDSNLDCNQYQGEDFEKLINKIEEQLGYKKEEANEIRNIRS